MVRLPMIIRMMLLVLLTSISTSTRAHASDRPNILFAIADDWGAHAGVYGTPWINTPHFDSVAKNGVLFNKAFTPNAKCAPSRAILLTGRNSWQLEAAANHMPFFPLKFKTFAETLAENGWLVGNTGKTWSPGEALNADGSKRELAGKSYNKRHTTPPTTGIGNNDYSANFKDFLNDTNSDQPWFFWYGAVEPHLSYEKASGINKGGKTLDQIDRVPGYWPDVEEVRTDMLDYAFEVEYFDRHLGLCLEELKQRNQLQNTLVIVTSDHGIPLPRCKGQAYFDSNHIPLAMQWPEGLKSPGRAIDDFVNFTDVAPTILDLAGIDQSNSGMASLTGSSLKHYLTTDQHGIVDPSRNFVLTGKERHDVGRPDDVGYPIRAIITNNLLYVKNFETDRWPAGNPETGYPNSDGCETKSVILDRHRENPDDLYWQLVFGKRPSVELYDLSKDQDCVHNIADDPKFASRLAELDQRMTTHLTSQGDPRMSGLGDIFDRYPVANSAQKDYYNRFLSGEKIFAGWIRRTDVETPPSK